MDKFKIKHPTNADFEEKLAKYSKLADDVWRQASLTAVFDCPCKPTHVPDLTLWCLVPGKHHDCTAVRRGHM